MMLDLRVFKLLGAVRWHVALVVLMGVLGAAAAAGQGLLMARVLDNVYLQKPLADALVPIAGVFTLMALAAAFAWLHQLCAAWTSNQVKQALRGRLYAHLLQLGPGYLEKTRTGNVQASLVDGIEGLQGYIGYYIPQLFIVVIVPLAVLVYLLTVSLVASALIVVAILIVLLGPRLFTRMLGPRANAHWDAYRDLHAQFIDNMQGLSTLKMFNASVRRGNELHRDAVTLYRATMRHMAISLIGTGITDLGMMLGTAFVIGVSAVQLAMGAITVPQLFIILFLARVCLQPLAQLNRYWHQGFMGIAGAKGVFGLLDAKPEVDAPITPVALKPGTLKPAIRFEDVSFAYNAGERPALRGLSFHVNPGETVALVGRSGAGKSTVVSLLMRYFDPQSGRVTLDGRDLREVDLGALRGMFAVVAQETFLFHGTVADNLRLAKPGAAQADLEAAARAANAHGFIADLPRGYDTVIGERGLKLSGGQRQRIAIARALLKDAPILILDEATSSVDAANEHDIQQALERLMTNRTTLVIAHRLSTISNADRIVVLDAGAAVESGVHRELLDLRHAYSRLVAAQQEMLA